jgi:archaemetzincin
MAATTVEEVVQQVARALEAEVSLTTNLPCENGFDPARRQWRAEAMLARCVNSYATPDCVAVGLTGRDLYVPSLNFVFGLAIKEAGAAIVSWYRLEGDEKVFVARVAKEIVHEVGHVEGLDHCRNEMCVMWFSNTLSETDRKEAKFCPACGAKRLRLRAVRGSRV